MSALGLRPFEPVDVNVCGHEFITVPATRSSSKAAKALLEEHREVLERDASELDEAELDQVFGYFARLVDLRLKAAGTGRTKPSTLLLRDWEADRLNLDQVMQLFADINAAEAEARPT